MAYTPVLIAAADYLDVRLALGLASSDTTTLPDATILGRPYLQFVERMVKAKLTEYVAILAAGGDKAATLADGVVLWTAARLAQFWLAAKAGDEVTRVGVGPYTTQYRTGPEWSVLAEQLAREAAEAFERVARWGLAPDRITMGGRTGPTRDHQVSERAMSLYDWRELLRPPVIKGHMYDDEDDT